jgi:hypothetical protein
VELREESGRRPPSRWSRYQAKGRADMRRTVKELFREADVDGTGILDKREFEGLIMRVHRDDSLPPLLKGSGSGGSPRAAAASSNDADGNMSPSSRACTAEFFQTAWAEIRKVPYVSENRDKRHLAEVVASHSLKDGARALLRASSSYLIHHTSYHITGPAVLWNRAGGVAAHVKDAGGVHGRPHLPRAHGGGSRAGRQLRRLRALVSSRLLHDAWCMVHEVG